MATAPRSRAWHVAENPGHGCCFSVGIQDAEGNLIADVVYREDGSLLVAAPDLYASLRAFISPTWEPPSNADAIDLTVRMTRREYDAARAALAKAEGRDGT